MNFYISVEHAILFDTMDDIMDLKTVLFDIMDICFKGGGKKFITVGNYCARWVNKEKQRSVVFSQFSLRKALKY